MDTSVAIIAGQSIGIGMVASFLFDTLGLKNMVPQSPARKWMLRGVLFLGCALLNMMASVATGVPIGTDTLIVSLLSLASAVMKYEFQNA